MPQYPVLKNLRHKGKTYTKGEVVTLPEADAERLQQSGVVAPQPVDAWSSGPPEDETTSTADAGEDVPLEDDFPGRDALIAADIETVGDMIAFLEDGNEYTDVAGIGPATQAEIDAYLDEKPLQQITAAD